MKITPRERMIADAYFLLRHPGWSWRDLSEAPGEVIGLMRYIEQVEAQVAEAKARGGG